MLCGFYSGALTFYRGDLALLLQLLLPFDFECLILRQKRPCLASAATLLGLFGYFDPHLQSLCSASSGRGRGKEEAPPTLKGECGRGYLFPQGAEEGKGKGKLLLQVLVKPIEVGALPKKSVLRTKDPMVLTPPSG